MNRDEKNLAGLVISEEVIARIAGATALDVPGVHSPVAKPMRIKGLLARTKETRSVFVTLNDSELTVDLFLRLWAGARIPDVSEAVQSAVKENIQNMTGKAVSRVNVHIVDIQPVPARADSEA